MEPRNHSRFRRVSLRKTIAYMLGVGVVLWWLSIEAYSLWVRFGLSPASIFKIPIYAFAAGLAIGFAASRRQYLQQVISTIILFLVAVVMLWFFGMLLGSVGIILGLSTEGADWVMSITLLVGLLGLAVFGLYLASENVASRFRGQSGR